MTPRIIDVHAHWFPPTYMALMRDIGAGSGPSAARARLTYEHPARARDPMYTAAIDDRLGMMAAAGIRTHILSFSSPNLWDPDPALRSTVVRAFNDGCLDLARAHRGRFKLFANVPLPHVDATLAETARLCADPDVVGIGMCTHIGQAAIDDPRFAPVYEDWDRRGLVVFVHPDGFCAEGLLEPYGMEWAIGAPFEDQIATLRIVRSGMITRYPRITWIVPHLGGTLPFLYERIDQLGRRAGLGGTPLPPLRDQLRTLLFDIVTPSARSLRLAREVLGAEKLVHGSDFPYVSPHDLAMGERLLGEAGFLPVEIEAVLHGTIVARLPPLA